MDIYDQQIAELTKHPEKIQNAWVESKGLFKHLGAAGDIQNNLSVGCLTQIRRYAGDAAFVKGKYHEELTFKIKQDERIPMFGEAVRPVHLPIFAEYQREFDSLQNS